ncbi:hypothetical protein HPB50_001120 [Hyalomma asiaticum]|uniref:Uncharacterized protein n=1 Tax=Hyalomma asiaticum TaxID=266040 RepID=A0ACB7S0K6_HYAAI|nr:hypothetical protein HPB50_001120 [Hyalomma asiaticum]
MNMAIPPPPPPPFLQLSLSARNSLSEMASPCADIHRRSRQRCNGGAQEGAPFECATQLRTDKGTGDAGATDTYKQALKLLNTCFALEVGKVGSRAQVKQLRQQTDETAGQFILGVDRLAEQCSLGTGAEAMIQDQVISGIACSKLHRNFFEMGSEFSVRKAVTCAKVEERAMQQLEGLQVGAVTSVTELCAPAHAEDSKRVDAGVEAGVCSCDQLGPSSPRPNACFRCGFTTLGKFPRLCRVPAAL